jgi:transposase
MAGGEDFLFVLFLNRLNFTSMLKYSLGIDMSSKDFHCCISSIDDKQAVKIIATSKFANAMTGFKALTLWIVKHRKEKEIPFVIVMEATGVYYENCAYYLSQAEYHVSVILPNKAKKYLQALGLKSKNDKIDAKGLSRMAAEQALGVWQPLSKFYFTLRGYTRQLQSLQELKTSVSNQLHASERSMYQIAEVKKQLKSLIEKLNKQIDGMEIVIKKHIDGDVEVKEKVEKICAIKGVGIMTVAVTIGEANGFALFENVSQLVSFVGYDVVDNQSGIRTGKTKISKKGNSRIRRAMHLPAFNVVRYEVQPFIDLFDRTYKKHGIKMKSYVAVQKKLLILIYTLWKKNESFDPTKNGQVLEAHKKNSPGKTETTQGKQASKLLQLVS